MELRLEPEFLVSLSAVCFLNKQLFFFLEKELQGVPCLLMNLELPFPELRKPHLSGPWSPDLFNVKVKFLLNFSDFCGDVQHLHSCILSWMRPRDKVTAVAVYQALLTLVGKRANRSGAWAPYQEARHPIHLNHSRNLERQILLFIPSRSRNPRLRQ